MKKHPGFKAVSKQIARKEGVGKKAAGAILAAATRRASRSAKRVFVNGQQVRLLAFFLRSVTWQ